MQALDVFFGHLRPQFKGPIHGSAKPRGLYEGVGRLGKQKVLVQLDVPWLPKDCNVERVKKDYSVWSVTCPQESVHG
jgi:hypothetical protein